MLLSVDLERFWGIYLFEAALLECGMKNKGLSVENKGPLKEVCRLKEKNPSINPFSTTTYPAFRVTRVLESNPSCFRAKAG